MSEIVVDASVALCWFSLETDTPAANRLIGGPRDLVAPSLLLAEMADGLWKKIRRGEMAAGLAVAAMKEIRRFIPHFVDLDELAAPAFELALEIDHTVYDCCYLALAERRGAPLVTLDRALVKSAARSGRARSAVHLSDWRADD